MKIEEITWPLSIAATFIGITFLVTQCTIEDTRLQQERKLKQLEQPVEEITYQRVCK